MIEGVHEVGSSSTVSMAAAPKERLDVLTIAADETDFYKPHLQRQGHIHEGFHPSPAQ